MTRRERTSMNKVLVWTAALALLGLGMSAQADVFNLGAGFTNLETVAVGDPGNAGELSGAGAGGYGPNRVCGAVGYNYRIGKYEVTAKQYVDFLNHKAKTDPYGLWRNGMGDTGAAWQGCNIQRTGGGTVQNPYVYTVPDDWANRPVSYVTYWSACRFVNWLGNGQGDGDTETGAYTLNGYNGVDGRTIGRNPGATWALTSEDEWYKAAYYKGGGAGAGYWLYPTKSDSPPSNVGGDNYTDPGNHASYYWWYTGYTIPGYGRNIVGEFENSASAYGTFDQGGNVWEWNEAIIYDSDPNSIGRGLRGGSFSCDDGRSLKSSWRICGWNPNYPGPNTNEEGGYGFRVSYIPEPSSVIALAAGLISILGMRRRRA